MSCSKRKGRGDPLAGIHAASFLAALFSVTPAKAGIQMADAVGVLAGARASRPQIRASARRARALALSHKGRRDPLVGVCTWFRMARLG